GQRTVPRTEIGTSPTPVWRPRPAPGAPGRIQRDLAAHGVLRPGSAGCLPVSRAAGPPAIPGWGQPEAGARSAGAEPRTVRGPAAARRLPQRSARRGIDDPGLGRLRQPEQGRARRAYQLERGRYPRRPGCLLDALYRRTALPLCKLPPLG